MLTMNKSQPPIVLPQNSAGELREECKFWMKAIASWKEVIARTVEKSGAINASPTVTADVARAAGELSLLADRLEPLLNAIEVHTNYLDHAVQDRSMSTASAEQHQRLRKMVTDERNKFRNLLSELFQLEEYAYKRFLS